MRKLHNYISYKNIFLNHINQDGQSLVELLVTIGIAAILMPAFLVGFSATRQGRAQQGQRLQAITALREAAEAVRIIRSNGWASFSVDGTYCPQPVTNGTTWELKSLTVPLNTSCDTPFPGITRKISIAPAFRNNTTHAIDPVGGAGSTMDPSTKSVTLSVSWSTPTSSSVSQVMYITRHENLSYLDTNISDFTAGTKNGTGVTNIYGGEIELGGTGASDWCNPNAAGIIKYSLSGNGSWTAISAVAPNGATAGHAYTTFGFNQSGNPFDSVNITDPSSGNPVVSAGSSFTADNIKTYGLYADPTSTYVYITSNSNQYQVDVVDTTNYSARAAKFTSSGGEPGNSVFVAPINGVKTGFVTAGSGATNKLYSFSVGSAPSGSLTQNGSISLAGSGNRVIIVGNYAFIATSSTTSQLQIVNVSNPLSMTTINYTNGFSVGNSQGASPKGATDLAVDSSGKYVFLSTSYVDSSHPDVFMIDVSTPTAPTIVGSSNTYQNSAGMSPSGIIPVSGNHMIVVGSGGQEYQVFYTYPVVKYCGGFTLASPGTKISAVAGVSESDGDNFAYILTDDSSGWFQIVPGGAGAGSGGGGGAGTFISQGIPLTTLTSTATFNNFSPVADVPPPTTISYQIGVAPTCASAFTFIGPDGTSGTSYATASAIPLTGASGYQNPGKCFKYKVTMNSNGSNSLTPILYQVNVNYSP
jgi:hypothetical protein